MSKPIVERRKIIIIGAGISGVLTAIKLRSQGITDFMILEMADKIGGTWRDNTYPGLTCDVPAQAYSYEFEPSWKWEKLYATGGEIYAYIEHCVKKYAISSHIHYEKKVIYLKQVENGWDIKAEDNTQYLADVVILCCGSLVYPKTPDIAGINEFTGPCFHSARWNHDICMADKRVGLIGTGASAVQITSELAGSTAYYALFQRTPAWISLGFQLTRPGWLRYLEMKFTYIAKLSGKIQRRLLEMLFLNAVSGQQIPMKIIEWLCKRNLDKVIDLTLKQRLTPSYNIGCKRLIVSDTFYDAIQRPRTALVTSGIERVVSNGIYTQDGQFHELDVLILATGFYAMDYLRGVVIKNKKGETLNETWANGAFAHRSVSIAGYPNLFMIAGPHSPYGNLPVTQIAEIQVDYLLALIGDVITGRMGSICAKETAQNKYNEKIKAALPHTLWASGCSSWYLDANNSPRVYPFSPREFRNEMIKVNFDEYHISN